MSFMKSNSKESTAVCLQIRLYGRVQGVFFRDFTKKTANALGIAGFVRNDSDGTVYIWAEGSGEQIEKFIAKCKIGTGMAKVERIEKEEGSCQGFRDFTIQF